MSAHLQGIDWLVWEICEDGTNVVLEARARVTQDQKIGTTLIAELAQFFSRVFLFQSSRESPIVLPLERFG
jgi:hypothetical protein